jgi:hypothetical protein
MGVDARILACRDSFAESEESELARNSFYRGGPGGRLPDFCMFPLDAMWLAWTAKRDVRMRFGQVMGEGVVEHQLRTSR